MHDKHLNYFHKQKVNNNECCVFVFNFNIHEKKKFSLLIKCVYVERKSIHHIIVKYSLWKKERI